VNAPDFTAGGPTVPVRHGVFAVSPDGFRFRVRPNFLQWRDAVDRWFALDNQKCDFGERFTVNGRRVLYFVVRAADDPDWRDSPLALLRNAATGRFA
jgi:hypothetical protein